MVRYNQNDVIAVEWYDTEPDVHYSWKERKTFLGMTTRRAGFYYWAMPENYTWRIGELPDTHFFKDGIVYQKPSVIVYLRDHHTDTTYFETVQEAEAFAESVYQQKKQNDNRTKRSIKSS